MTNLWISNCRPKYEHGHCLYCCRCLECSGDRKRIMEKFLLWLTENGYNLHAVIEADKQGRNDLTVLYERYSDELRTSRNRAS